MAATQTQQRSASKPLRKPKKQWPFPLNLYQSSVGKKWVMAITGIMLVGFVIGHMVGNLKIYLGVLEHDGEAAYDLDIYGEFLKNLFVPLLPETVFLWIMRAGLLTAVGLHIHSFYSLNKMNLASGSKYASKQDWLAVNFAGRSMRYSGVIVLFYILFHIADLTLGWIPGFDFEHGAVQSNVVGSLSNPIVALFYIIANVLLCLHIFHGIFSVFQSLGINSPKLQPIRRGLSMIIPAIILVGNLSIPVAVLTGVVDFDECESATATVEEQVEQNCVVPGSHGHGDHSESSEIEGEGA